MAAASTLYDVSIDGFSSRRLVSETATGAESILVRNVKNCTIRNVTWTSFAALTVQKDVVYCSGEGGAAYTDGVTIESCTCGSVATAIRLEP